MSDPIYERDGIRLVVGTPDARYSSIERSHPLYATAPLGEPSQARSTIDETLDSGIDRVNRAAKGAGSVFGNFWGSMFGTGSVEATGEKLPSVKHIVDRTFDTFNETTKNLSKTFSPLFIVAAALGGLWLLKD